MRIGEVSRKTKETDITVKVNLDGNGTADINTPVGFLNHMLELLSKHSGIDISLTAKGDTEVDNHHTVEDVGISLGEALTKALGDHKGIERYGWVMMTMDECRCDVSIDLGGRANLVYNVDFSETAYDSEKGFDYKLIKEFMKALTDNLKSTLHINTVYGDNNHHIAEAVFKGLARSLKQAVKVTGSEIPSSKGVI
jgi:imidazoleglycerol-phosphate dehydratase